MRDRHAPSDEFTSRLEARIGREIRQRNAAPPAGTWRLLLTPRVVAGVAVMVVVSMAIGGAAVAAAYQAQNNERRDALTTRYDARLLIARDRLTIATEQLDRAQRQVAVGLGTEESVLEARSKVTEAEALVRSLELQLAEIHVTSAEPLSEVSSPLVAGRDFVSERWRIEMAVPKAALELETARMRLTQRRVAVGLVGAGEVRAQESRVVELQAGLEGFERKLDIRQRFLKGEFDGPMADLRLIEAETEQRRKAALSRLETAKLLVSRTQALVARGLAASDQVKEADLHVMEIQLDLAKLDADLAAVQKQIAARRGK